MRRLSCGGSRIDGDLMIEGDLWFVAFLRFANQLPRCAGSPIGAPTRQNHMGRRGAGKASFMSCYKLWASQPAS
jgi:hypothetical protein